MNWSGPILTDSGGFQVMSLADLRKLTEEGVTFRSHVDGSRHMLSPERSMEIQKLLGSDIVMCFDECPALPASDEEVARAMRLSMRWAERSKEAFGDRPGHALFGIQQGGVTRELREESAENSGKSASTATRWAGSPWARGRRLCSAFSIMRPTCCPGTGRAT
jgi:queuine tRNA-ribosyltransferase